MSMRGRAAIPSMLLLAGCAGGAQTPTAEPPPSQTAVASGPVARIGSLDRQPLASGSCGLFIWAAGDRSRLVLHADSADPAARVHVDGAVRRLSRTAAEGGQTFQEFNRLTYEAEGLTVNLNMQIERRPDVIGGAVAPRGAVRFTFDDGAAVVLPVSGLIACKGPDDEETGG